MNTLKWIQATMESQVAILKDDPWYSMDEGELAEGSKILKDAGMECAYFDFLEEESIADKEAAIQKEQAKRAKSEGLFPDKSVSDILKLVR